MFHILLVFGTSAGKDRELDSPFDNKHRLKITVGTDTFTPTSGVNLLYEAYRKLVRSDQLAVSVSKYSEGRIYQVAKQ